MPNEKPPAGWYSDPGGAQAQRWWDGNGWTGTTRPYPPPGTREEAMAAATAPPTTTKRSFGTTYRETWTKTGVVMGALTAIAVIAGYDNASSYGGIAFLIDGALAFAIGFLTWGSLINLIVAAVRHNR